MADEKKEKGGGVFSVPEDPTYIRTPRKTLLGVAGALLAVVILLGTLSSLNSGQMLIFIAPLWIFLIYIFYMFCRVWKAYKYSIILLLVVNLLVLAATVVVVFSLSRL